MPRIVTWFLVFVPCTVGSWMLAAGTFSLGGIVAAHIAAALVIGILTLSSKTRRGRMIDEQVMAAILAGSIGGFIALSIEQEFPLWDRWLMVPLLMGLAAHTGIRLGDRLLAGRDDAGPTEATVES